MGWVAWIVLGLEGMHVEKQGAGECMLATLAALSGWPLPVVRRLAVDMTGRSWNSVASDDTQDYWQTVPRLCRCLGLTAIPLPLPDSPRPGQVTIRLPDRGRGWVTVRDGSRAHIMPWADGLVYNPLAPAAPISLDAWLAQRPGWWAVECRITG